MMMTLYDCSTAPSPRRARILLAEKGAAHDTVLEKAQIASSNWRVEFEGLLAVAEALRNGSPAMALRPVMAS